MKKEDLIKELKELSIKIPDGFYKDCNFYHEAIVEFILSKLQKQKEELNKTSYTLGYLDGKEQQKEEFIKMLPEEKKRDSFSCKDFEKGYKVWRNGYNLALEDIKTLIKK